MYAILLEPYSGGLGGSCARDLKNMKKNLISRGEFKEQNIYILSNNISGKNCYKTIKLNEILNKVNERKPDVLWFHISGHGYNIRDTSKDEKDGYDEGIKIDGRMIIDDTLNEMILKNKDTFYILCSDTCHSGSMFDLDYTYNGSKWAEARSDGIGSTKCNAVSFAGCGDRQLSSCDIGESSGFGGSLTVHLLDQKGVLEKILTLDIKKMESFYPTMKNVLSKLRQKFVFQKITVSLNR